MGDASTRYGIGTVSPDVVDGPDRWGPFVADLDLCERLARLRVLRAIAVILFGPRSGALTAALRRAECNGPLKDCVDEIKRFGALERRRLLAVWANLEEGL